MYTYIHIKSFFNLDFLKARSCYIDLFSPPFATQPSWLRVCESYCLSLLCSEMTDVSQCLSVLTYTKEQESLKISMLVLLFYSENVFKCKLLFLAVVLGDDEINIGSNILLNHNQFGI